MHVSLMKSLLSIHIQLLKRLQLETAIVGCLNAALALGPKESELQKLYLEAASYGLTFGFDKVPAYMRKHKNTRRGSAIGIGRLVNLNQMSFVFTTMTTQMSQITFAVEKKRWLLC